LDNLAQSQYNRVRSLVNEELKTFRPEFLNRLDEIIVFRQLTKDEKQIAEIMLREVSTRLVEQGIALQVTERFKDRVCRRRVQPQLRC